MLAAALAVLVLGGYGFALWWLLRAEHPSTYTALVALCGMALTLHVVLSSEYPPGLNEDELKVLRCATDALRDGNLFGESCIHIPYLLTGAVPLRFGAAHRSRQLQRTGHAHLARTLARRRHGHDPRNSLARRASKPPGPRSNATAGRPACHFGCPLMATVTITLSTPEWARAKLFENSPAGKRAPAWELFTPINVDGEAAGKPQ